MRLALHVGVGYCSLALFVCCETRWTWQASTVVFVVLLLAVVVQGGGNRAAPYTSEPSFALRHACTLADLFFGFLFGNCVVAGAPPDIHVGNELNITNRRRQT